MSETVELDFVAEALARTGRGSEAVIPVLQALQEHYGYLPRPALVRVCELSEITPAQIAGVATFYSQFSHKPRGQHTIAVCHGTACHVKGADLVHSAIRRHLEISAGEDTDGQGLFTVEKVACLGCCTLAPAVRIDEVVYGHLSADGVERMLSDFLARGDGNGHEGRRSAVLPDGVERTEVRVGLGSCCQAGGSAEVHSAVSAELARVGAAAVVKQVGCVGMCHQTPLVEVVEPGCEPRLYAKVNARDAAAIVRRHFPARGLLGRLRAFLARGVDHLLSDESWEAVERYSIDVRDEPVADFLGHQVHVATEGCGELDPLDLDEYLARGGFAALRRAIAELAPEEIVARIQASGLRGRGGAGFPTGRKWEVVRSQPGETKYVICNGDEGDPGAFMDRMILESYPFRVIEGMAIAARAVGAREGIFYIRAEYPLAVARVGAALETLRERGLLEQGDFALELRVVQGAGAFICGEETALLESVEGRRGMPRLRPPYPAERGLWQCPTLVNNVETLATVPWILNNGPDALAALGTERSKGTKVFSLAGKIARGGLIEVPMGITIREVVEEIGGGIAGGKRFKAVQVGGPSGGCVPAELGDTPVDFEALSRAGAMMGSGGLVVLDENDCMVDVTAYFLRFTQEQSCGKCTPCRVGTRRMLDIVERIRTGRARGGDLDLLEDLARQVQVASLCGLGRTAPNPVLSTLRYFRAEYEAHIEGRCPAGRCKELIRYAVGDGCIGCTLCAQHCPVEAIPMTPYEKHAIDDETCTRCDACRALCPVDAITVESPCRA